MQPAMQPAASPRPSLPNMRARQTTGVSYTTDVERQLKITNHDKLNVRSRVARVPCTRRAISEQVISQP
jgi:hypothetical protein